MAKKKKKKKLKKLHEGRSPLPAQRPQILKDRRKKRDKEWKKRIKEEEK